MSGKGGIEKAIIPHEDAAPRLIIQRAEYL